jgi:hypothetical protein
MLGEQTGKWEGAPGLLQVDRAQKPAVCLLEEGWELLAGARECRGKLSAHNIEVSLVSVIWGLQHLVTGMLQGFKAEQELVTQGTREPDAAGTSWREVAGGCVACWPHRGVGGLREAGA